MQICVAVHLVSVYSMSWDSKVDTIGYFMCTAFGVRCVVLRLFRPGTEMGPVTFDILDGDVPHYASFGVYISQLTCIRFARVCSHVTDFYARNKF